MSDDVALTCPQCHQAQLIEGGDGTLACPKCGERFASPQRICPYCETINEIAAQTCVHCGKALRRTCPKCGTVNWISAGQCASCGQRFDTIGHIAAREELRFVDRFSYRAEGVADLKATEHAQSQQRMDGWWEQEHQRRAALAAQQRVQKRQELRLIYIAGTLIIIAIIVVVVIALASAHG